MAADDSAPTGLPCPDCRRQEPTFARTRVAFDYAFPWDGLIQGLKFSNRTEWAKPLGEALAQAVQRELATERSSGVASGSGSGEFSNIDALLPMPLSGRRLAERGYNQALLLARHVAQRLRLPLDSSALQRPIDAPHQVDLTREQRLQNLRGVFMLNPAARHRIQGRRLALIDDVVTTGSTAAQASQELLRAGARAVEIWALARAARSTPKP